MGEGRGMQREGKKEEISREKMREKGEERWRRIKRDIDKERKRG